MSAGAAYHHYSLTPSGYSGSILIEAGKLLTQQFGVQIACDAAIQFLHPCNPPNQVFIPQRIVILAESEIQHAIETAKAAFPHLTDWEYINEVNSEYFGFSLWGQFVLNPNRPMSPRFFVTLDTYKEEWRGCLTIGQPSYLWSSADMGDAHLLSTDACDSLEDTISALKGEMRRFFDAFSAL